MFNADSNYVEPLHLKSFNNGKDCVERLLELDDNATQ